MYREGCLDIAPLLLTLPYLLPSFQAKEKGLTNGFPFSKGFLITEIAGSLLRLLQSISLLVIVI